MTIDYKGNPFYLNEKQIGWIEKTLQSMSIEEKVGQLFLAVSAGLPDEQLVSLYEEIPFNGVLFRAAPASQIKENVDTIQRAAKIPMLIAANLESGGSGIVTDGTEYASQLQIGATLDPKYAEELGDVSGLEASAVGCNYAFAPVVDILYNWRNPIVLNRAYADNHDLVLKLSKAYMKGIMKHNIAVSIKHFPGDGVDERDQHLLASVNNLSCDEWDATFGKVYKGLIDEGAHTVMVGHILLPSYSKKLKPDLKDKNIMPATLAPELINGLLRDKLGFNGVVISDSAVMTGLGSSMPRSKIPASCINAGCDIFLFGRNIKEDYEYLLADVKKGVLSFERLNEAVARVLALKASIGLWNKTIFTKSNFQEKIGRKEYKKAALECANQAITLVKDTQNILPLDPKVMKRVLLYVIEDEPGFRGGYRCTTEIFELFKKEGFTVTLFDKRNAENIFSSPVKELKKHFDIIVYVANTAFGVNNTVNRLSYIPIACGESPQHVQDIPTIFVSLGNPFHFVDVPMIKTIINCYTHTDAILESLMDKLTGRSSFKGKSPVDPFCGFWGSDF